MHTRRSFQLLGIIIAAAAILMACSFGANASSTLSQSTTTGGTTPPATSATLTPPPALTCSAALPGAGAANGGAHFTDLPYPTGALATGLTPHHSGTGEWTISLQQVCVSGSAVSTIRSYYSAQLPTHSWAISATLPFDGSLQAPCGDPYCWGKDAAPRYVGLESVTDHGGGIITYQLRLFVPPPAPNCSAGDTVSIYTGQTYETTWSEAGVPLPPLTLFGVGDGYSMPTYGHDAFVGMCSVGTATSITNFFQTELPAQGWTHGSLPASFSACGASSPGWYKGHVTFGFVMSGTIPNGEKWQMVECTLH
ncbi:MAG: hypothetical protein H0X24_10630 [Ktedonobacterales bacterium]|nr:hypothetical protein [Ktedonobacterales bacterium]